MCFTPAPCGAAVHCGKHSAFIPSSASVSIFTLLLLYFFFTHFLFLSAGLFHVVELKHEQMTWTAVSLAERRSRKWTHVDLSEEAWPLFFNRNLIGWLQHRRDLSLDFQGHSPPLHHLHHQALNWLQHEAAALPVGDTAAVCTSTQQEDGPSRNQMVKGSIPGSSRDTEAPTAPDVSSMCEWVKQHINTPS